MKGKFSGPISSAPAFAVLLGVSFSVGAHGMGVPPFFSVLISLLVASSWIFLASSETPDNFLPVLSLLLFMTLVISFSLDLLMDKKKEFSPSMATPAKVIMIRPWGKKTALLLDTPYGRMAAYTYGAAEVSEGSEVDIRGVVFDFKKTDGKNSFDEGHFWRSKGALKKLTLLEITETAPPSGIFRWRNILENRIKESLPRLMSGYMLALTVGKRDRALEKSHREAGTVHLLAVSGFHVGIMAFLAALLLPKGRVRMVGTSFFVWSYVLFAGFPPGGVRAAIMLQIYLLGLFLGRSPSAFNSVSVAGLIMLLHNPWTFYDIGWRLSMLAALTLCAAAPMMQRGAWGKMVGPAGVWVVTASQAAAVFGEVPTIGLAINILAIPLFSLLFPMVLFCSLPTLLGLPSANLPALFGEYLLESWEIFSAAAVDLMPLSVHYVPILAASSAIFFFGSALFASGAPPRRVAALSAMFAFLTLFFI